MKLNKHFNLFIALTTILFLYTNCTGNRVMNVDDLLKNAESLVGQDVVVEGLCTHVCAKSGMKLLLQGSDKQQTLRAESGSSLGKFNPESIDKQVMVRGKLVEERIDEAYVKELEKEILEKTKVSHGEGEAGCATEQAAEGVTAGSSEMERIDSFRARIAERKANEGKEWLSLYHIVVESYQIID